MHTSSKEFGELGELTSDSVLATAVLDRLFITPTSLTSKTTRGNGYRLKDRAKIKFAIFFFC